MTLFVTIIHVLVCFILIAVILLQAGKGQGLTGATFGGGNVQSLLGTRAADFLTKATAVAAICFLFTSIGLDILEVQKSKSLLQFSTQESTVDMDAIKKALETVQTEEAATQAEGTLSGDLETATDAATGQIEGDLSTQGEPDPAV